MPRQRDCLPPKTVPALQVLPSMPLLHPAHPDIPTIAPHNLPNSIFGDGYLNKSDDDSEEGAGEDTGDGTEGTQE